MLVRPCSAHEFDGKPPHEYVNWTIGSAGTSPGRKSPGLLGKNTSDHVKHPNFFCTVRGLVLDVRFMNWVLFQYHIGIYWPYLRFRMVFLIFFLPNMGSHSTNHLRDWFLVNLKKIPIQQVLALPCKYHSVALICPFLWRFGRVPARPPSFRKSKPP